MLMRMAGEDTGSLGVFVCSYSVGVPSVQIGTVVTTTSNICQCMILRSRSDKIPNEPHSASFVVVTRGPRATM